VRSQFWKDTSGFDWRYCTEHYLPINIILKCQIILFLKKEIRVRIKRERRKNIPIRQVEIEESSASNLNK